jgi:hypothetical protein
MSQEHALCLKVPNWKHCINASRKILSAVIGSLAKSRRNLSRGYGRGLQSTLVSWNRAKWSN